MALSKASSFNFNKFPTEIKEMIFGYLLQESTIKYGCIKRTDSPYGRYILPKNIYNDTCAQLLLSVCRNWYEIIQNMRKLKNENEKRQTKIVVAIANMNIFKWALTQNLPNSTDICYFAAKYGKFDILKYAISHNYAHNVNTYVISPLSGNLDIVQYLYNYLKSPEQKPRPWWLSITSTDNFNALLNAVRFGNLDIVKWLFKIMNLRHLYAEHMDVAIHNHHFHILEWQLDMKPKYYLYSIITMAIQHNYVSIIIWLIERQDRLTCKDYKGSHVNTVDNANNADNADEADNESDLYGFDDIDNNIYISQYLHQCIADNNIDILSILIDYHRKLNRDIDFDSLLKTVRFYNYEQSDIHHYLKRQKLFSYLLNR